jgi:TusA-related sulfurtransferase
LIAGSNNASRAGFEPILPGSRYKEILVGVDGWESAKSLTWVKARLSRAGYLDAMNEGQFIELDARGLEPPQPMIRILEALATLPAGAALKAWTDRRPVPLFVILAERGYTSQTEEDKNGSYITYIRRN